MSEPIPYGEMVQELTHLRAQYEQFIIDRERERIIKLLEIFANGECDEYCSYRCECYGKYEAQKFIALIKGETE